MNDNFQFSEKAELLYKFDKASPLFAVVASNRAAENNFEEAEKILTEGLQNYNDYATAYLILSKVQNELGKHDSALENLDKAMRINPNPKIREHYEKLLSGEKKAEEEDNPILKEINEEILPEKPEYEEETAEEEFVSDTLAAVYKAQGAFEEALKMYEKLIEKNPEKKEAYLTEIEELKKKIN